MWVSRSFFSRTIEPQLASGATHDMRILTGSALLACPALKRPRAQRPASTSFDRRMISSPFRRACTCALASVTQRWERLSGVQLILASLVRALSAPWNSGELPGIRYRLRHRLCRGRLAGFLMPDQKLAAHERHYLDQAVAHDCDLEDAGEHTGGIGKARGRHHGAAS